MADVWYLQAHYSYDRHNIIVSIYTPYFVLLRHNEPLDAYIHTKWIVAVERVSFSSVGWQFHVLVTRRRTFYLQFCRIWTVHAKRTLQHKYWNIWTQWTQFKLHKTRAEGARNTFFTNRVVNVWNALSPVSWHCRFHFLVYFQTHN